MPWPFRAPPAARDERPRLVERGQVGVYPVGALAMAFHERLGADLIIGRKASRTSDWVSQRGAIRIDGELRDVRERWRQGLVFADRAAENRLPELILVCPNADQLEDFLEELMKFFDALDAGLGWDLENVPKFLLASSGLYWESFTARARERVAQSALTHKAFFARVLERRLFRGVAYQAGVRLRGGARADYRAGRGAGWLVLSRSGAAEDRRRILEIIRSRGYEIRVEVRRLEGEHDKALVNLLLSAFTQLYAVKDGRLLEVRFGDLLADSPFLPPGFAARPLRDPCPRIRERMRELGEAVVGLGKDLGVYPTDADFEGKFLELERRLMATVAGHQPSSFQLFLERLLGQGRWDGAGLLPTERFILEPLIAAAREGGDQARAALLESFTRDLEDSYRLAVAAREDLEGLLGRLLSGEVLGGAEERLLGHWVVRALRSPVGESLGLSREPGEAWSLKLAEGLRVAARAGLARAGGLSELWLFLLPLGFGLLERRRRLGRAVGVGLDGWPGAGKTSLAARLAALLEILGGGQAVALSIDDFYYAGPERARLGLSEWGIGAHDLSQAPRLRALKGLGPGESLDLPVFDKASRERSPASRRVQGPVSFVLLEGFGTSFASRGYGDFSGELDYRLLLEAEPALCRTWRLEAGWRDRRGVYGEDRERFERDFAGLWAMIERQAREILPESRRRADLILRLGEGHRLLAGEFPE